MEGFVTKDTVSNLFFVAACSDSLYILIFKDTFELLRRTGRAQKYVSQRLMRRKKMLSSEQIAPTRAKVAIMKRMT